MEVTHGPIVWKSHMDVWKSITPRQRTPHHKTADKGAAWHLLHSPPQNSRQRGSTACPPINSGYITLTHTHTHT